MIKQIKQLAGDSLIYGISGVVTRMIGIFLIPIYTRIFVPKDYGIINLINTTFFLIGILVVCALDNATGRWFYDSIDKEDHKKSFGAWFWWQLILSGVIAVIIIILSPCLSNIFFKEDGKPIYLILSAIGLITNILPSIINNWYRVHRRAIATVSFALAQTLVTIALSVLFVIILQWKITGVFAAMVISSAVFSLVAIQQMKGWLGIRYFDKIRLKAMLKYSLPFIPAALAYWLLNSTDSYFLAYFKNKAEVGLFGIGASLAAGVGLFTSAFQQAWGPFAFSIMNNSNAKLVYAKVFLLYGYVIGLLAALLMLFAPEILKLLTAPAYWDAAWVAGILGYNLLIIGFTYIASIGASIAKKTASYGVAMVLATVLTMLLNIILIPKYGKEGSALATVAAQLLVPAYLFYKSNKYYAIPYKYKEVIIIIMVMAGVAVGIRCLSFENYLIQVTTKIIVAIILMLFVLLGNIKSLKMVLSTIRKKKLQVS